MERKRFLKGLLNGNAGLSVLVVVLSLFTFEFTLFASTVVGWRGGVVVSEDGSATLEVPPRALRRFVRITLRLVSLDPEAPTLPQGTQLLTAVECLPHRLTFRIPALLTFRLEKADVPGTAVEIYLYDGATGSYTGTGIQGVVGVDAYSVTASITHFSVYAALKNLTPQETPLGGGVRIPLPDMLTGAFSHALPAAIPPGRKGMQPALALSYKSQNPNSWIGVGYTLGSCSIMRSAKEGAPAFDDAQDTFIFVSDAGATDLVWLADNLYQAKIESAFVRFYKEANDTWRIVAKDGSALELGGTSEAKETSPLGTFAWYLTKSRDTNGNTIAYSYVKDEGRSYLSHIEYTGNDVVGTPPRHTVDFVLEPRPDVPVSYLSGARIATAKRLKEIVASTNGEIVWHTYLTYGLSADTDRSLLASFQQCAADGLCFPAQQMSYCSSGQ